MQLPAQYRQLIECFDALPGIGPRAAARMAQHVLEHDSGERLQQAILTARKTLQHCSCCRTYSDLSICPLCTDDERSTLHLLVVSGVEDQFRWEEAGYRGGYFVLHGLLSPVAGIGPRQLHLPDLKQRVETLVSAAESSSAENLLVQVVLESSVEADATGQFIEDMLAGFACRVQLLTPGQLAVDLQRARSFSAADHVPAGADK